MVQLTVPPEISIYSDASRTRLILRSGAGYAPLYPSPTVEVLDSGAQVIRLTDLVPSSPYYVDANNPFKFGLL